MTTTPFIETFARTHTAHTARTLRAGLRLALLLTALSGAGGHAVLASAASFHCPKNASASEKLVCNDPALSTLDDRLAVVYQHAKDATPDRDALEADRIHQWQWRQHNCKDRTCVANWYNRRIGELQADVDQGKQAQLASLKTDVAAQDIDPSARDAIMKLKAKDLLTARSQQP